ncbi:Dolichyl-phosphate-mannose-protein mannosyltransferase [Verrucomicrobium sp. GAS474]|uniref:glycosyltransferase family 39 protein n=1 Tax=Verrucomicrobium sp. GAS474 TaxID=1882831 RepID=UPI00087B05F9|nr:glycosyltransferase family 39 protein [Verrucomicrobium sp. GAS474]SDT86650.1 Dolichyl-phosphate-mannose-protein mannosyltransferase [Verrucomicrobium sp. GAS474]
MNQTGYRKRVTLLLFALLLVRFWYGQTFELTGPEAMVWLRGKHLALGYWSQGPLLPLFSALGVHFFGVTELGIRWVAAAVYTASGFLLFYTGRQIFGARAGFCSLLLYVVLPLYAWQALLLSDATLNIGLMALALLTFRQATERNRLRDWAVAGAVSAVAVCLSGWNLMWAGGLLLFRAVDEHRHERWWRPSIGLFLGLTLLGFLPFFLWHAKIGFSYGLSESALKWLGSKQQLNSLDLSIGLAGLRDFLCAQGVWLAPTGVAAIAYAVWRSREEVFLRRSHLFLLCLAVPGIVLQVLLTLWNLENQESLSALYLPLLLMTGSVAARRIWGAHHLFWRRLALVLLVLAGAQSVSGLMPRVAERIWPNYSAVRPVHARHLAEEVERLQREVGAGIIITDWVRESALLQFYLPLHPFVHVVPGHSLTQFDFWAGYGSWEGEASNALLMLRTAEVPEAVRKDFALVRPLPPIPIPEAKGWHFFLCERMPVPPSQILGQP